jgi:chemotaxis protein MotA
VESDARSAEDEAPARFFEAAAGYTPTLGILGAVLGLIHVMRNLSAPDALGSGIAVAFVATVCGVGVANLLLLPLAGRLREHAAVRVRRRELMTQGICAIHQRVHPRVLTQKLRAFAVKPSILDDRAARLALTDRARRLPA